MMEKIEWYQEVLELEPSSKVFFPLAKLFQNNNQPSEAIATLRQGLDRHPEFFEARLMLIDLLENNGQSEVALYEVERLGSKLNLYPGFWKAWGGVCAQKGQLEVSVALRLLAAFLSGREITLFDILQQGLKVVLGENPAYTTASIMPTPAPIEKTPTTEEPETPYNIYIEESQSTPSAEVSATLDSPEAAAEIRAESRAEICAEVGAKSVSESVSELVIVEVLAVEGDEGSDADFDEEPFSLRTKTMATVLVEQGDLKGAMDIYEELLAVAVTPDKKRDLQGRIDELKTKMKMGPAELPLDGEKAAEPLRGKQKLLDALENLAKRLEVRASD